MKIYVLSDAHFELISASARNDLFVPADADLTIIAGDYHRADDAVRHARTAFPCGPLVMVAGNHEHYSTRKAVPQGIDQMRADARADTEVHARDTYVLENETIQLDISNQNVRVIGCTLWTDFKIFNDYGGHSTCAEMGMNDYRVIKGEGQNRLKPADTVRWHVYSRTYIQQELQKPFTGKTIVVTHHLPSMKSVNRRYLTDSLTPAFASACDDLLDLGADLWIHGHSHDSCDYMVNGRTRVVCNPRGYSDRDGPQYGFENRNFVRDLLIEI